MPETNTQPDYSVNDLRSMLAAGGDGQPAVTPAPEQTEAPAAEAAGKPVEEAKTTPPESDPEKKQDAPAEKDPVEKRIGKAVAKQRDAERRLEAAEARLRDLEAKATGTEGKAAPSERPKPEQFDTYDEYEDKLLDWKLAQRQKDELAQQVKGDRSEAADAKVTVFAERYQAAVAEIPDFAETVKAAENLPFNAAMRDAIFDSPLGPRIMYELAKNSALTTEIAHMGPVASIRAIGALEAKLSAPEQPQPKRVTAAPAPPKTVGGGSGGTTVDLSDPKLSMRDFKREMRRQLES
jgi:hypothetical protein